MTLNLLPDNHLGGTTLGGLRLKSALHRALSARTVAHYTTFAENLPQVNTKRPRALHFANQL